MQDRIAGLTQVSTLDACPFAHRAMLIWPRLDRRRLARCGCDSRRIAAYIARRTSLSVEVIQEMLEEIEPPERVASFYFG